MLREDQATWKDHMKENQGPRLRSPASQSQPHPCQLPSTSEVTLELPAFPAP